MLPETNTRPSVLGTRVNAYGSRLNETPIRKCSNPRSRHRKRAGGRPSIGDWLVKDGYAHIRIDNCGGKMWGIVAWEKTPGASTTKIPTRPRRAARRSACRSCSAWSPTKPEPVGRRDLQFQNGKMYDANISMANENTLKLEGCLAWASSAAAQNWTRVKRRRRTRRRCRRSSRAAPQAKGPAAPRERRAAAAERCLRARRRADGAARQRLRRSRSSSAAQARNRASITPRAARAACPSAPAGTAPPPRAW